MPKQTINPNHLETIIEMLENQVNVLKKFQQPAPTGQEISNNQYTQGYIDSTQETLKLLKILTKE